MLLRSKESSLFGKSKFYGVYLLCSESSDARYRGKCYVGFTVNPNRRINQHNRGKEFGGAQKTNNKGPWKMVLIVHGFPNNISALQFEWAWQQPAASSRLKYYPNLRRKLAKETYFQYNIRIISRMLNVGPWERLPLIIHWLQNDYKCQLDLPPPKHMRITSEPLVFETSLKELTNHKSWTVAECHICMLPIEDLRQSRIGCINPKCKLTCHMICLANHLLTFESNEAGHYIPVGGQCPLCSTHLIWLDVLRNKFRVQQLPDDQLEDDDSDDISFDSDIEIIDEKINAGGQPSVVHECRFDNNLEYKEYNSIHLND